MTRPRRGHRRCGWHRLGVPHDREGAQP
jgi:hypothetical protein